MAEEQEYPAARYRLRSESYMPRMPGFEHELLQAGAEVTWAGKPGPHLEPLDPQAHANYVTVGAAGMSLDPFSSVPLTNAATDDDILAERIARAMGKVMGAPAAATDTTREADLATREATVAAREAALAAQEAAMAAREAALAAAPTQQAEPVLPPPPPPPPAAPVLPPPPPPPAPPAPQAKRGK